MHSRVCTSTLQPWTRLQELTPDLPQSSSTRNLLSPKSWCLTFHSPRLQEISYRQSADFWPSTVLVCKESAIAKVLTFDLPQSLSARNRLSLKSWRLTFQGPCLQGISYRQTADAWPSTVLVCKESAIAKQLTPDLPQSLSARNMISPTTAGMLTLSQRFSI